MNHFLSNLSGPVADALGWTLLHALWQGFALVLPTAIALHGLRHQSSTLRYTVSVSALLVQLLVSVVTFWLCYEPATAVPSLTAPTDVNLLPVRWSTTVESAVPWHEQAQYVLQSHLGQFVLAYLIGVVVFALRLVGGWLYLQRLSRAATAPASTALLELTGRIRSVLAIRAVVRVRESARIAVPMVVGVLKPVLLLPIGLSTHLSLREVEAVLAHELAHVKRHDYVVNLLQSVVEVLYFFHPALWWLSARVREEREHCCDDLAVRAGGGDGRTLAQALARVEELRLAQAGPTPALAMAFATKRQQLLYRVRRVLGVPTRPVVSNGSLAGLTLATILLVSASVFAVQQRNEPQPKPNVQTGKAQSTRRHTIDRNSEYGMAGNQRIGYVVWKGRKLPVSHVTRLQSQLDRVMSGQLNLDNVKQPDRDILLTIIEKNVAFDAGMKALGEGMARISYSNMEVSARTDVPANRQNPAVEIVDSIQANGQWVKSSGIYQSTGDTTLPATDTSRLRTTQRQLETLTQKMQEVMAERQPAIDRLTKEMSDLTLKVNNGDYEQKLAPLMRQLGQLSSQQSALMRKLAPLNAEISRLSIRNEAKSKALLQQKEQQSRQLEVQMEKLGAQMEKLTEQVEPLTTQMEPYHNRMGVLADSIGKLYEPTYALSEQISQLSEQIAANAYRQAEQAMRQAEEAMRQAERSFRSVEANPAVPPRPARAPRPPKAPARPKIGISPAAPVAPISPNAPAPAIAPVAPAPRPTPKAAPAPKPASTPKVAPVPKPDNE